MNVKLNQEETYELVKVSNVVKDLPIGDCIRTFEKIGQFLLHDNEGIIRGGQVYFFIIRPIGLGIITVELAPYLTVKDNTFIK